MITSFDEHHHLTRNLFLNRGIIFLTVWAAVCLWVLCTSNSGWTQEPEYRQFGPNEGFNVQNQIYRVISASDGYIWVSGSFGIFRYDGYKFHYYNEQQGLPDSFVLRGLETIDNEIWFQSFSGEIARFEKGHFYPYRFNEQLKEIALHNHMISFEFSDDQTLHVGLGTRGYQTIDSTGTVRSQITSQAGRKGFGIVLNREFSKPLLFGVRDSAIDSADQYCFVFDSLVQPLFQIPLPATNSVFKPKQIIRKKDGHFLFTAGPMIYEFSEQGLLQEDAIDEDIYCSFEDSDGDIWLGTKQDGIYRFPNGDFKANPMHFLSGHYIHHITEDREHGIWVVCEELGLLYIARKDYLIHPYNPDSKDVNAQLPMSITDHGLYLYSDENGTIQVYRNNRFEEIPLNFKPVKGVELNVEKHMWDSTEQRLYLGGVGFMGYLDRYEKAHQITIPDAFRPRGHLRDIVKSRNTDQLFFVYNYDILRVQNDRVVGVLPALGERTFAMTEGESGVFWLGAESGLWKYENGHYSKSEFDEPICNSRIFELEYHNGEIWIQSGKGVGMAIVEGDSVYNYPKHAAFDFQFDRDTCWSYYFDVLIKHVRYKNDSLTWEYFHIPHSLDLQIRNFVRYRDTFYLATNKGLLRIARNNLFKSSVVPVMNVSQIKINSRDTVLRAHYELNYEQDLINIQYVGVTYQTRGETMFRYKMEGVDDDWTQTRDRNVQYTKLTPGSYRFEVTAQNQDGLWNPQPAVVTFEIAPPFWATWWFRTAGSLAAIGLMFWGVRWRIRRAKQKTEAEFRVAQRFTQLELKALRAQMNPHFMFNTMNSIQHYIANNEPQKAQLFLSRFAKLIRNILDQADREYITLQEEIDSLELYLELECLRFDRKFSYRIEVDESLDPSFERIPPMLTQPYVENAIWHGLMHREGVGNLLVRIKKVGEDVEFVVEDNGIGRKASAELNKNSPRHRSKGMLINRERLELLYSKVKKRAEVLVEDLQTTDGHPAGTRVAFTVPLH